MVSQNVDYLLQQVKSLSLEEREQFIELLRTQSQDRSKSPDDDLAAKLAKNGIKLTVPPKPTPEQLARFKAWRPIEMPGGPLSDDIIRDRR
jgi:hypothetical protein